MTITQTVGAVLLAIPLVTVIGMTVHALGWLGALGVWSFSAVFTACIVAGIFLLGGAN